MFKIKRCISRLFHLASHPFFCQRLLLCFLNSLFFHCYTSFSGIDSQCRRHCSAECQIAAHRFFWHRIQIISLDLIEQLLVPASSTASDRLLLILQCHHVPAVAHFIITLIKSVPVVNIVKLLQILRQHLVPARILLVKIQIFPVNAHNTCRIFRLFHPAFDLQGGHPRAENLRQQLHGTHIFGTERIFIARFPQPSAFLVHLVRKTAWLRASSPVSAPASDQTGHQALSGIAVAQRSMNKAFDFQSCGFVNLLNLCQ